MKGRHKGQRVGPVYAPEKAEGRGAWLYNARRNARLTIEELAAKSRVSVRTIKRIESGDLRAGYKSSYRLRLALGLAI